MVFHIITVIFVIAKLAGYFQYSWWMVFAPSIAAVVIVVGLFIAATGIMAFLKR